MVELDRVIQQSISDVCVVTLGQRATVLVQYRWIPIWQTDRHCGEYHFLPRNISNDDLTRKSSAAYTRAVTPHRHRERCTQLDRRSESDEYLSHMLHLRTRRSTRTSRFTITHFQPPIPDFGLFLLVNEIPTTCHSSTVLSCMSYARTG